MTTAFAVVIPFFYLGNASGHDFEFHMNSWIEVLGQWHLGIVYPRWAALAHFGYGEPRFIFYPPISWMLGAFLGAILPWPLVPGAYIWIVLTLSGCSMFVLARRWLSRSDATFAAAIYAANPYHLVIAYWRSAFAELLVAALLPLLLLFALHLEQRERKFRPALALAMIVALAWLTNVPGAIMVTYSLALLVAILAALRRSPRMLFYGGAAVVLGGLLAAFYIIPAAYEQRWVDIMQVLSAGARPRDNFLFTYTDDGFHNRFNATISVVAIAEMVIVIASAWLGRRRRREISGSWWLLMVWAAAAILLMFPFTLPAWKYLPKLRFTQFPWRWLLCLNVAAAILLTLAFRRWAVRVALCLAMLGVITLVWHRFQQPWWDNVADINEMLDNQQDGPGYEGVDEYTPIAADPYQIKHNARRVTLEGPGRAQIHVVRWDPELKIFTANMSQPGNLTLRLFNYPAWRVEVNGRTVSPRTHETTGQMMVPVQAGENQVQVRFTRTADRAWGAIVSIITALGVAGFAVSRRRTPPALRQNP